MKVLRHIIIICHHILLYKMLTVCALESNSYCRETLKDHNVKQVEWSYLQDCLQMVNGEIMSKNTSENAWRLVKMAFDTIDNIPSEAYKYMGFALTSIPLDELRNISMENVDVVEAFGAIRSEIIDNEYRKGFNTEQLMLIAQKVRSEWLGKNPQTYSEYDLKAMGEILCYLNVSDIEKIHTDAFTEAAEWIGLIEQCPHDRLQALANLARRPDAFGEPRNWSKLEVSIIGNILNGLPANEINAIAKEKLELNHFYRSKSKKQEQSTETLRNSSSPIGATAASTVPTNVLDKDTNV